MEIFIIFIFILLFLGFGFVVWLLLQRTAQSPKEGKQDQALLMLQNQVGELSRMMDTRLMESARAIQSQFSESTKIIKDVTERLTKLDETNKRVVDFAHQLQNLQDILKNPKQRGVLGEYYLEAVLKNVLPPGAYKMQYAFEDGDVVDAAIFIKEKIIPVDSKFSLENYNRLLDTNDPTERKRLEDVLRQDLKTRIDETSKYIKPEEGTMEFAFMFIPSEAVYYDLLINKVGAVTARDLVEYAFVERKVIIVSPTSFLAYLQTVLQGLRALQIEESAKEIRKRVGELGRHLSNYDTYLKKLGNHLGTTVNMYNSAYKEFGKIDKDVLRISGSGVGIEPSSIETPKQDEV